MLGAIAGDVIGSVWEGASIKTPHFHPLIDDGAEPTDDTVLTVAIADAILNDDDDADLVDRLKYYARSYPYAGYGGNFVHWVESNSRKPYNSWGNGSAMRVSPVGWAYNTLEEVLHHAKRTADVTHNHPEGVKGAQATAAAIFLARTGKSKVDVHEYVETTFGYDLTRTLEAIRPGYQFEVSCQGSVPESIIAFLESESYEDCVRKAISLGGDTDTMACIAGGIAEAFYGGVPKEIADEVRSRLDERLRRVLDEFTTRHVHHQRRNSGGNNG
jgi:ADP-ribosylglycohydrolase